MALNMGPRDSALHTSFLEQKAPESQGHQSPEEREGLPLPKGGLHPKAVLSWTHAGLGPGKGRGSSGRPGGWGQAVTEPEEDSQQ